MGRLVNSCRRGSDLWQSHSVGVGRCRRRCVYVASGDEGNSADCGTHTTSDGISSNGVHLRFSNFYLLRLQSHRAAVEVHGDTAMRCQLQTRSGYLLTYVSFNVLS